VANDWKEPQAGVRLSHSAVPHRWARQVIDGGRHLSLFGGECVRLKGEQDGTVHEEWVTAFRIPSVSLQGSHSGFRSWPRGQRHWGWRWGKHRWSWRGYGFCEPLNFHCHGVHRRWSRDTDECGWGGTHVAVAGSDSGSRTGWVVIWAEEPWRSRQTDGQGQADDQETGKQDQIGDTPNSHKNGQPGIMVGDIRLRP